MKKAFTLSEVLVTLSIIGVVAVMTIPTLVQRYKTVEYTSRAKKTYSELTNAMAEILRQGEAKRLSEVNMDELIENSFDSFIKVVSTYNGFGYATKKLNEDSYTIEVDKVYLLPDGAMFGIKKKADGDPGYKLVVDVNGKKEPNTIGRDIFFYWIKENGTIDANKSANGSSGSSSVSDCTEDGAGFTCAQTIMEDGWEMNY